MGSKMLNGKIAEKTVGCIASFPETLCSSTIRAYSAFCCWVTKAIEHIRVNTTLMAKG